MHLFLSRGVAWHSITMTVAADGVGLLASSWAVIQNLPPQKLPDTSTRLYV